MRRAAALLLVLGGALWLAAPFLQGHRVPVVHVRWRPGLTDAARRVHEATLGLTEGARLDERTYKYALADPSLPAVRAIVDAPDVEDTHYIDRDRFTLPANGPLSERRYGIGQQLGLDDPAGAFATAALWCAVAGVALLILPWAWPRVRRLRGGFGPCVYAFLTRGIPHCSAEGAAAFRIVFMLLLVPVFAEYALELDGFATIPYRPQGLLGTHAVVRWMLGEPTMVAWFERALMLLMVVVAAGVMGRWSLIALVGGLAWWMVLRSQISGHHPLVVVLLTLICFVPARWNDALALTRRRHAALPSGPTYGYVVWIPTFILGVACVGAAYAKLEHGPEWILNGTARYHFMVDLPRAPVEWGLAVATRPRLAIVMSALAVLIEAALITAAFSRRPWYRLLAGAAGLAVFAGFYLFQGERWLGWWLLFLGFLPWHRFSLRREESPAIEPSRAAQLHPAYLAIIVAIAVQQLVVSALRLEVEPLFSAYDMYSTTYSSPEEFDERTREIEFRVETAGRDGTRDATACLERAGRLDAVLAAARTGVPPAAGELAAIVAPCHGGAAPERLDVLATERGVDWRTGRFVERYRDRLVLSLPLDTAPYNR